MHRLSNPSLPMIADRLYASETSTQAPYASSRQDTHSHQAWLDALIDAHDESALIAALNKNSLSTSSLTQHHQHSIDTYVLHVYIHERHLPAFSPLHTLINSPLTLSFDTPSGLAYRHLYLTAIRKLDHDGSYGYYRLIAQPLTYRLHQHTRSQIDTDLSVQAMVAERTAVLKIDVIDDSGSDGSSEENASWTPARLTQWQSSDWAHICERLTRQGLSAYLRHAQTEKHTPPTLVITSAYPSTEEGISQHIGPIRYQQVLHDRTHAPIIAISEQISTQPSTIRVQRFNSAQVSHPTQSAEVVHPSSGTLTLDTPAAFAPVTDTETIDDARLLAHHHHSRYHIYHALAHCTDLNVADTFTLVDHSHLNQPYRATHILHLARNSLAHVTGLTVSTRHHQRHASSLESGRHLTQLTLLTVDTPWVGSHYSKQVLPPMTGITESQSDSDSRNHMTPTKPYLLDAPAQAINRLETQAGSNYGSHFTHRADDQTLMQAIGDGEHLMNTGSLLSSSRPSLFTTTDEQAVESGYRNTDNGVTEWISDHRDQQAYSQLKVDDGQIAASLKMGVINDSSGNDTTKKQGIHATTNAQINIKSGQALTLSTQPQTHAQVQEHNYQQHTPTLTQTGLGGQHLAERLTQLATGLGRQVNDHNAIKTQLETIAKEQQTSTHHTTPFTLIDSNADISYVSEDTLLHRTMGEMISTTQQDMRVSSGDSHQQISNEALNVIADGQVSFTNAKDNITLSAHTGKLEATAKQDVNIASSTKEVEVVATNKVTITAGGSSITLDGSNITIAAKEVTEKGGKHTRAGGGMDGLGLGMLPSKSIETDDNLRIVYDEGFVIVDEDTQEPIPNCHYKIVKPDGSIETGITDDEGRTKVIESYAIEDLKIEVRF
nr:DUF2345 domain-containing protein [uncultured Psychrobacter sp.]